MGRDENQPAAVLQHPPDLAQDEAVVVDVFQEVEAHDLIERALLEGKRLFAHLDEIPLEQSLARLEVRKIEVGADPVAALAPQEIAQDALGAAQI